VTDDMQQHAVQTAIEALDKYTVEKDVAMHIKKEFDRLYSTTWHCVVGKQ
jgi:dynein light chain LC8-type